MRMRDQVIVIIAVAVATLAVAANVFAYTQAVERRAESDRFALTLDWTQPVMPSRNGEPPAGVNDPATDSPALSDPTIVAATVPEPIPDTASDRAPAVDEAPATACSAHDDCSDDGQTFIFEPVVAWEVAVFVRDQGYEEGVDGPPGAADPDAESRRERKEKKDKQKKDKDKDDKDKDDKDKSDKDKDDKDKDDKDKDDKDKDKDDD